MATICIRGGSISAGHKVKHPYVCSLMQNKIIRNHTIVTIARFGDSSFEGIWEFDSIVLYKPDILILHFGMDDIYRPVYRSEFKENLVRMVQKARDKDIAHIILVTLHLVENPYLMERVESMTNIVREVALDLQCKLATVHIEWMNYLYKTRNSLANLLSDDERYPNERGHKLIAKAIQRKLIPLLQ